MALRGADDGRPDATGPQRGLSLPPAHSPPAFLRKVSAALRWPACGTQPVPEGRQRVLEPPRTLPWGRFSHSFTFRLCFLFEGFDSL